MTSDILYTEFLRLMAKATERANGQYAPSEAHLAGDGARLFWPDERLNLFWILGPIYTPLLAITVRLIIDLEGP